MLSGSADNFYQAWSDSISTSHLVIQIAVPLLAGTAISPWVHVHVGLAKPVGCAIGLSVGRARRRDEFQTPRGFRADFIGLAYGEYVVYLSIGDNPAALIPAMVTLSPEQETVAVELSIPAPR